MPLPLLILTPHSSGQLPAPVLHQMLGDAAYDTPAREALTRRVFLDGDPYTDLLYLVPEARTLNAPWSRFVVDLNRERDDDSDNGVVKRTLFDRTPLYPPEAAPDTEDRLRRYWDSFDAQVRRELDGVRLLLVGHCMSMYGPSLGPDHGQPRPALCLMTGTPGRPTVPPAQWEPLRQAAEAAFAPVLHGAEIQGAEMTRVAVGEPWTTDDLSLRYGRPDLPAFGLEMNAGLYLTRDGRPRDERIRGLNACLRDFAVRALELLTT